MTGVGDELALRAALDPAWDAVLAVFLSGLALYPDPFHNVRPPRTARPRSSDDPE